MIGGGVYLNIEEERPFRVLLIRAGTRPYLVGVDLALLVHELLLQLARLLNLKQTGGLEN